MAGLLKAQKPEVKSRENHKVGPESSARYPKSCLDRVFNSKFGCIACIDMREYIDCSLACSALGGKCQFYCTVFYITLDLNCEAQGVL